MINIVPVILCGGSGTRLWPLSRSGFPKQFLALAGTESLFQQTIIRAAKIADVNIQSQQAVIVTNEEHRFLAVEQLRELNQEATFILEPVGKNTAPAVTMAALFVKENFPENTIMVMMPSDQTIQDEHAWLNAMRASIEQASLGGIVTLGVTPTHPETGYGYIQKQGIDNANQAFEVVQFTEKPSQETAQKYIDSSDYLWNSGIFVLQANTWLDAVKESSPIIYDKTSISWEKKKSDAAGYANFIRPEKESFLQIPSDSIDYAVIEKSPGKRTIHVVPLDAGWSDLGAWDAVWSVGQKDQNNNVIKGDVLFENTKNSYVNSSGRLIAVVGVDNVVVIETSDAVLVADKSQSQSIKKIVEQLEEQKRKEKDLHRKVHRPWGWYDSLDEGQCFKVKRIMVNPGSSLSLQMHHHRAEHWIVVKGTAAVMNGDQIITLTENQSTYIPQGQKHRLTNIGSEPMEIIEVQTGSYLGEDDIVRFEDVFGRI